MSNIKDYANSIVSKIKEEFVKAPLTYEETHRLAMSGLTEDAESRLQTLIKETDKDIKVCSANGELAILVHFYDKIIQSKIDDFAKHYQDLGFETEINQKHNFVIILW